MANAMQFPESWKQFLHDYEFLDYLMKYTNGSMIIQSYRVEQMIEHYFRDAVPVVRCRECKNWEPYGSKAARKIGDPLERYGGCKIWRGGHLESDFCSNGKRRDQSADVRNMGQFAGGGKTDGGGGDES